MHIFQPNLYVHKLISLNIKECLNSVIHETTEVPCLDFWLSPECPIPKVLVCSCLWMHCKYCHLSIVLILSSQEICPLCIRDKWTQAYILCRSINFIIYSCESWLGAFNEVICTMLLYQMDAQFNIPLHYFFRSSKMSVLNQMCSIQSRSVYFKM